MFTGLVREVGRVRHAVPRSGMTRLEVAAAATAALSQVGDSVAIDGICLTVTSVAGDRLRFDVSQETRRLTTAGDWRPGQSVHVEPALRASDPLGGHLVLGHVDGVGQVVWVARRSGTLAVTVAAPPAVLARCLPKGSIAIDGVSLTLDEGPFDRSFTVTLVPHTVEATHLGHLRPGARVNLESDILAKAAARPVRRLTLDRIQAYGWQ
jgi:riboflavin synthase alpha subunit